MGFLDPDKAEGDSLLDTTIPEGLEAQVRDLLLHLQSDIFTDAKECQGEVDHISNLTDAIGTSLDAVFP